LAVDGNGMLGGLDKPQLIQNEEVRDFFKIIIKPGTLFP
jgi:hypothetical protein